MRITGLVSDNLSIDPIVKFTGKSIGPRDRRSQLTDNGLYRDIIECGAAKFGDRDRSLWVSLSAQRHLCCLAPLQRLNGLNNPSALQVGRVLKITLLADNWRTVTVRPGDSIGALARSNGCRVEELTVWNGLNSSVIHPGQKLRIRK